MSAASISNAIYEDLGKVVFHDPVVFADPETSNQTPSVDVRKIREVSSDGKIAQDAAFYASLGTRVKDVNGDTETDIEPCWFGLNATGTLGRS